jgi:hypothetical protein
MKKSELQSVVKELNQKLWLDPPIKINQKKDELIAALRERSGLILWQSNIDLRDTFTEETAEILDKITNMTDYIIQKLFDGLKLIVNDNDGLIEEEGDFANIEVIFHKPLTKKEINSVVDLAYKLGFALKQNSDVKITFRTQNSF